MKNGDKCDKKRCLKEINPHAHPGIYMGTPFVYEDFWMACVLCTEIKGYVPWYDTTFDGKRLDGESEHATLEEQDDGNKNGIPGFRPSTPSEEAQEVTGPIPVLPTKKGLII
jgi:hypothetical protein